jgi:cell division septation protein DedD
VDPDARSPEVVQVVVGNDSESVQVNASRTGGLDYEATVDTDALSPGTYSVYGVVRGPQELKSGDLESLGVSDRQEVTVSSTDTGGSSGGGSSGGGSSGGGGGSMATETPTSTATPTPNSTLNRTATSPTPTVTMTPTPMTTTTPTTTDTTASPSPTPTDDEVVTPATTSADEGSATETGGQPGLGVIAGTVALLAGALLLTRRCREN